MADENPTSTVETPTEADFRKLQTLLRRSRDALAEARGATAVVCTRAGDAPGMQFVWDSIEAATRQVDLADLEMVATMRRTVGDRRSSRQADK